MTSSIPKVLLKIETRTVSTSAGNRKKTISSRVLLEQMEMQVIQYLKEGQQLIRVTRRAVILTISKKRFSQKTRVIYQDFTLEILLILAALVTR